MSDKLRERFESEAAQSPYEFDLSRWPNDPSKFSWPGMYREYAVQCAWEGFQLGYKAAVADAIKRIDEIDDGEQPAYRHCQEAIRQLGGE